MQNRLMDHLTKYNIEVWNSMVLEQTGRQKMPLLN
jgi:hypothetical protein